MKTALTVFGTLLVLMGTIWFLQGANILTAGSSPMIGDTSWEYYGGMAVVAGLAMIVIPRRKAR